MLPLNAVTAGQKTKYSYTVKFEEDGFHDHIYFLLIVLYIQKLCLTRQLISQTKPYMLIH